MNDLKCYSCSSPISEKAIFCASCAKQVRCKKCHELIEPNANACIICGTLIGGAETEYPNEILNTPNVAPNRIEYKETLKMRSLNASFTNQVGGELTETLKLILTNRIGEKGGMQKIVYEENGGQMLPEGKKMGPVDSEKAIEMVDSQFGKDNGKVEKEMKIKDIFHIEENKLTLIEPRIKATSKFDFARRLSYLFLYGHELENRPSVPRSDLNTILTQNAVLDSRVRTWISTSPDLEVNEKMVKLRTPGREKANKIIDEVFDQNNTKSWLPGMPSRRRLGKRGNSLVEDKKDKTQLSQETTRDETKKNPASKSGNRPSSRRPSGTETLENLIGKGYFNERRMIGDIISYCGSTLALTYKNADFSTTLARFVHKNKLKGKQMLMANTSTSSNSPLLEAALANLNPKFRGRIISSYLEIKKRYSQAAFDNSFDTSGLSAGKFCEATLRFLQEELTGSHIPFNKQIQNFADESRKLIQLNSISGPESLRTIIPRALVFLYTLRGKRGIGHLGGDVDANSIDAATIVRVSDWIICELIRVFHNLPIEEAQDIVDTLSSRNIPDIWEIGGKKRILRNDLDFKQKVLLFAYSEVRNGVMVEDLFNWTEYSSLSMFKKSVLFPLHQSRLIEYDQETDFVFLSPTGVRKVELEILNKP